MDDEQIARILVRLDNQAKVIRDLRNRVVALEQQEVAQVERLSDQSDSEVAPVDRRTMTDTARRRVEKGATNGAGTDTCAKCKRSKEPSRFNSNRCGPCEGKGTDQQIKSAKRQVRVREAAYRR